MYTNRVGIVAHDLRVRLRHWQATGPNGTRTACFLSMACVALALVPAGAHLAELPHKVRLPARDYLVVQQLYAGRSLFGSVVSGALLSTGVH